MIPKIIHYCWFGGNPLPELAQKCIASWEKFCPDYEIKRWDETNFDINCNDYVREAYEAKKWAFVSDYVRLWAMVKFGGIYMDTDVEVIKNLDTLLQYEAVSGFESQTQIPTGLMACREGFALFKELLEEYNGLHFLNPDGSYDITTNVQRITEHCKRYGFVPNNTLQTVADFTLLPQDYLCPKSLITGNITLTKNTLCIHHFDGSWLSDEARYCSALSRELVKTLPASISGYLAAYIATCKYHGILAACRKTVEWVKKRDKRK